MSTENKKAPTLAKSSEPSQQPRELQFIRVVVGWALFDGPWGAMLFSIGNHLGDLLGVGWRS